MAGTGGGNDSSNKAAALSARLYIIYESAQSRCLITVPPHAERDLLRRSMSTVGQSEHSSGRTSDMRAPPPLPRSVIHPYTSYHIPQNIYVNILYILSLWYLRLTEECVITHQHGCLITSAAVTIVYMCMYTLCADLMRATDRPR